MLRHDRLFAFTAWEEVQMSVAKAEAARFMEDYGKGAEPRQPGMYYRKGEQPEPTPIEEDELKNVNKKC